MEQIVQDMEAGELNLENALKKFEEGMKLSKFCSNKLDEIEQKINVLIEQPNGEIITKPFEDTIGSDVKGDN